MLRSTTCVLGYIVADLPPHVSNNVSVFLRLPDCYWLLESSSLRNRETLNSSVAILLAYLNHQWKFNRTNSANDSFKFSFVRIIRILLLILIFPLVFCKMQVISLLERWLTSIEVGTADHGKRVEGFEGLREKIVEEEKGVD